jgi:hypothetical protein
MSATPNNVVALRPVNPETLDSLAVVIRDQFQASRMAAISAVEHARACGDALAKAKEQVAHGEWLTWLAAHCPEISESTAQRYMKVACRFREDPLFAATACSLPLRDVVGLLADSTARTKAARVPDLSERVQEAIAELDGQALKPNKAKLAAIARRGNYLKRMPDELKELRRSLDVAHTRLLRDALRDEELVLATRARDALIRHIKALKDGTP